MAVGEHVPAGTAVVNLDLLEPVVVGEGGGRSSRDTADRVDRGSEDEGVGKGVVVADLSPDVLMMLLLLLFGRGVMALVLGLGTPW